MRLILLALKQRSILFFTALLLVLVVANWGDWSHWQMHIDVLAIVVAILVIPVDRFIQDVLLPYYRFKRLEGKYLCYSYVTDMTKHNRNVPSPSDPDEIMPNGSCAIVKYIRDVNLTITVTDGRKQVWLGEVIMETENVGVMTWHYTNLGTQNDEPWRRNGVKRLAVLKTSKKDCVKLCLFTDAEDSRFGREVLINKSCVV